MRSNALLCVVLAACSAPVVIDAGTPVVDAGVAKTPPSPVDWPSYGGNDDQTHFSPLSQLTTDNVSKLGLAWFMDLPEQISTHSAPIAVDGVLYFATGYSVLHAVKAETGEELWSYDPDVPGVAGDKLRPAWGVRGIGWWKNHVIVGTQDGRLISVDAQTGTLSWSTQTTLGPDDGRYITGAPLVFDDTVVIGHGGADFAPVRGYVTAYDTRTGEQRWRFFVVPGNPADGPDHAASDDVMAMAAKTWKGEWWKHGGGGTVWNSMTFDRELNRVYLGTGNGSPWNQNVRSPGGGDNLFLASIVALDATTGKYVWHSQLNPGETWDFNSAMDIEVATLSISGKPRKVLLHAPKNGFMYVIDRETGKLVSAEKFTKVTWAERIDLTTGRPVETPQARFPNGPTELFPGSSGGHNWMAMAFSPQTGLLYMPVHELSAFYDQRGIEPEKWSAPGRMQVATGFAPMDTSVMPKPEVKKRGALLAWNPVTQQPKWSVPYEAPFNGGVLATGGGLLFQGTFGGGFVAYDARDGKTVWAFDAENGIIAQPITYMVNDRQYVSVLTGIGGIAALGGSATPWSYRHQRRRLLTFALDGKATLPPPLEVAPLRMPIDTKEKLSPQVVKKGSIIYSERCLVCHGAGAIAGGQAPDLRASGFVQDPKSFEEVVRVGVMQSRGMPKYEELTDDELTALRTFIRFRARAAKRGQP